MENDDSITIRLSAVRALLGAVFPQLRAVYVCATDNVWRVCFYVDGELSDSNRESLTIAATEISADLPDGFAWEEEWIERLDAPARIDPPRDWKAVYARKEPTDPYPPLPPSGTQSA